MQAELALQKRPICVGGISQAIWWWFGKLEAKGENDMIQFLMHPERRFIREQDLEKISSKKKALQEYRFFLFSDLLIYASPKGKKFRPHRVIHLSLCRIIDLKDRKVNNSNVVSDGVLTLCSPLSTLYSDYESPKVVHCQVPNLGWQSLLVRWSKESNQKGSEATAKPNWR